MPALTIASATRIGVLPLPPGTLARDLAFSASAGTQIRYGFGDTLGPLNPDGTLSTNSGATALIATPLSPTVVGSGSQLIPFTPAEAQWNLEGIAAGHPDRIALPIMGVVPTLVSPTSVRVFYAVDRPLFAWPPNAFYAAFPMSRLGSTLWPLDATALPRDPAETPIPFDFWPTGFRASLDGTVLLTFQHASDSNPLSDFYAAVWSPTLGLAITPTPAFSLDCSLGYTCWWNAPRREWLATYIDMAGRLCLMPLSIAGIPSGPSVVAYQIPNWASPWDGYAAAHITGADTGGNKIFKILYSRVAGFLTSEQPCIQVTIN